MISKSLRVGLVFDRSSDFPEAAGPVDRFAEFEPESTIKAMETALAFLGHRSVRIGSPMNMLGRKPDVDLVWNIAEGYGTRNREAWAPVICEMRGIPFIGSDALTLSISLDKALSKQICRQLNIPTPDWQVQSLQREFTEWPGSFPVFVKPGYEGTAKGIGRESVAYEWDSLEKQVLRLKRDYNQDVLVESFLPGAEYTCALAGTPLRPLPVLQRALHRDTRIGLHAVVPEVASSDDYHIHHLPDDLEKQLQNWSIVLCEAMNVMDFARIDFKLDAGGQPYFLEINPLPTFATDNTFAILAEIEGKSYDEYLAGIIGQAIDRAMGRGRVRHEKSNY